MVPALGLGAALSKLAGQSASVVQPVAATWDGWGGRSGGAKPWEGAASQLEEMETKRASDYQQHRADQQLWKKEKKEALEEMLPKATGREAMMEKKAVRRQEVILTINMLMFYLCFTLIDRLVDRLTETKP
jgi:hypothetical protein